jgi:hypothetical protein
MLTRRDVIFAMSLIWALAWMIGGEILAGIFAIPMLAIDVLLCLAGALIYAILFRGQFEL